MVIGVVPSPPRFLPLFFIAHGVQQQSHCSSIFHRVLLTHALAFSASQFVRKQKSLPFYTRMNSEGFELTKLTYTRLEDNLIRHRGDRQSTQCWGTSMRCGAAALLDCFGEPCCCYVGLRWCSAATRLDGIVLLLFSRCSVLDSAAATLD